MHKRIAEAERIVDHVFADKNLIASALTHPSAVEGRPVSASYERLEFLGDSTQLKISLVSGQMLSPVAEQLGLAPLILMGESERGTGARGMHSALENVYESIVGALYLDAGFDVTHDFVLRTLEPHMSPELARKPISPKSRIQEVVQRDMHCAPEYKLLGEEGPAHDPTFTSVVMVDGRRVGKGQGSSKKSSESAAAADALVRMGYNAPEDFEGEGITN